MKHRDAIKLLNEDIFRESYEKHDGNYYKIAFDFNVFSSAIFKTYLYRKMPWWSKEKYPDKHRIPIVNSKRKNPSRVLDLKKPNPAKKKYFISEEQFKESYERNEGIYFRIAKDFGIGLPSTLSSILRRLSWWSIEKYPSKGSNRKHFISEDKFKESYERHEGNYNKIAKDFGINKGGTLRISLDNLPWWSREKYPVSPLRKYSITEDKFKDSYERHDGNYSKIAKDFGINKGGNLRGSLENLPWWSREKYPSKGSIRKYHISEGLFKVLYRKHDGKYHLIAREMRMKSVSARDLIRNVKNLPWWSIEKYPPNVMPVSGDKKRLNRGQYQNAITSYLAGEYGYKTSSDEIKEETELLISDIRDAYKEGLSVDEISEAFNVEKAIVFRVLDLKKPNPQGLHMRRPVRIKSNPQNLMNVNEIEDFIDKGIQEKRITSPEVQNWLNTTFRKHLINVIPSESVSSIPTNAPEWMTKAFENNDLKRGVISNTLKDEYYHTLDFISENKPKLGSALEVLAKVSTWDKAMTKKRREFEARAKKYGKGVSHSEMGEIELIDELDDGYSIVQLMDDKAKDWEGVAMGHCVGGHDYENEIVYSLRDANLMPHATRHIKGNTIVQMQGKENKDIVEKYHDYIFEFIQRYDMNVDENYLHKLGLVRIVGEIDVMPRG